MQVAQYHQELDETWQTKRWVMDLMTCARDRSVRGGPTLSVLHDPPPAPAPAGPSHFPCSPAVYLWLHDELKSPAPTEVESLSWDPVLDQQAEDMWATSLSSDDPVFGHQGTVSTSSRDPMSSNDPIPDGQAENRGTTSSSGSDKGYGSDPVSGKLARDVAAAAAPAGGAAGGGDSSGAAAGTTGAGANPPEEVWTKASNQPGTLRVFAAYKTGLNQVPGVQVRVTPRTSSREVVKFVIQQLNEVVMKTVPNGPIYAEDQWENFCLVVVTGERERVLRDDFQLLQLQNPWVQGQLYVRLKSNLLAALDQGHVTSV